MLAEISAVYSCVCAARRGVCRCAASFRSSRRHGQVRSSSRAHIEEAWTGWAACARRRSSTQEQMLAAGSAVSVLYLLKYCCHCCSKRCLCVTVCFAAAAVCAGHSYDLLTRNCCHFCEDLAAQLEVGPVPGAAANNKSSTAAAAAHWLEYSCTCCAI
jgi:hypothetical protein